MRVDYVLSPILTTYGLLVKTSLIHEHGEMGRPNLRSLCTSLWGITVLNAELKLTNSILT